MAEFAYKPHLNAQDVLATDSPADQQVSPAFQGRARMVTYPYDAALVERECKQAAQLTGGLAELERESPGQSNSIDATVRGNVKGNLAMTLEHHASYELQRGNWLSRDFDYRSARTHYLAGLCYAERYPQLRAELLLGLGRANYEIAVSAREHAEKKRFFGEAVDNLRQALLSGAGQKMIALVQRELAKVEVALKHLGGDFASP